MNCKEFEMRQDRFLPDMLLPKPQKEITSDFVSIVLKLSREDDGL